MLGIMKYLNDELKKKEEFIEMKAEMQRNDSFPLAFANLLRFSIYVNRPD